MRILIAPDKFKGTLAAPAVAAALAQGVRRTVPGAEVIELPLADGGEGTVDVLLGHFGGHTVEVEVPGPLGDPVSAHVALLDDGRAVIESSAATGLVLVSEDERRPRDASTAGVGVLLAAAHRHGADQVLVGIGGTGSTDGGTGAAASVGYRFLDSNGSALPPGGGALRLLQRIEPPPSHPGISAIGLCDVTNPLTGPTGAARVFGPQKGAPVEDVSVLEEGLQILRECVEKDLGRDLGERPGAGAGGGLGFGLAAFFDARLVPGAEMIAEAAGLSGYLERADIVVTGEGHLDRSSFGGKVTGTVLKGARVAGIPCLCLAGGIDTDAAGDFAAAAALIDSVGRVRSFDAPAEALSEIASALVAGFV